MRKTVFAALFMFFLIGQLQSQDYKIGIKFGPSLSFIRTSNDGGDSNISPDGTSARAVAGAFVDINFKDNYFFHTGITYANKKTNIKFNNPSPAGSVPMRESYSHEYLQIPLLLKLFTNEVLLDTQIYFNFGVIPEVRLNTSNDMVGITAISQFQDFDLAGNLGGGIERSLGPNTRIFVGLNYNLGFVNMVKEQSANLNTFNIKSNLASLELGIKF